MPRSYASDLLVDDIDLDAERVAGRPYRSGRRKSDLLMVVLAAGASAAVLFNALMMQGPRRGGATSVPLPASAPAELRQVPVPASPSAAPAAAAPVDPQPVAPAPAPVATAPVAPLPPVKPPVPPKPAAPPVAPATMPPANVAPAVPTQAALPPAEVAVSARVMEIQKALARLGYGPIHIDGRVSDATRDAIRRFERDRRMPITGEISDRLVRGLNEVAGFNIR